MTTAHPRLLSLAQWLGLAGWRAQLPHSSTDHVVIWLTRGQGLCLLQGLRRGMGARNALCIPAGALFSFTPGPQVFGLVCLIPGDSQIEMPNKALHLRVRDARDQSEITGILETMQREQNANRPFMSEALAAQAQLLTVWVRRWIAEHPAESNPAPSASDRLVQAYANLIEYDYATGKPMADYAKTLGVTPTHLTRCCRSSSGLTAATLLTQRILHDARDKLETTTLPAKDIAASLGFRSAAYFSRFIVKHTDQTPSALRKASNQRLQPTSKA
ncbi:DNA-binding transcriptional regulator AraC [Roseovarius albus]|uniref:DNA-binding transcriptional regulator AraC n=1 Tax=Roseovarius albus TaxID=1247867 RepID=A0A1X6YYD9_9RHOB|nr:helix-turn-helix domain-containing protein [Roseovarius albus]SLN35429.1 DNA-binding transcriptional regulator AraC [Roseovarius albus]